MAETNHTAAKPKYVRKSTRNYTLRSITRTCKQCGKTFEYISTGINPKNYCSDFCRGVVRHVNRKARPLCVVEGCSNPRHYSNGICNSCYYRLKRTGSLAKRDWKYRSMHTSGYVKISNSSHALSKRGMVFEHRKVLYDAIGPGPHACHWCGCDVDWIIGRASRGALVADHLDGDKANNNITNLVPACNPCNAARGMFQWWIQKHADDPWLWKLYESFQAKTRQTTQ